MFGIFEMVAINFNICSITRDTILKHPYVWSWQNPNKCGNLPYVQYLSIFRQTHGIGAIQACRLNTILKHTARIALVGTFQSS